MLCVGEARQGRELHGVAHTPARVALPEVDFRIVCSKGTYIRSLVRDFGQQLGVGAYLAALCRTRIGEHRLEDAQTIEQLAAASV